VQFGAGVVAAQGCRGVRYQGGERRLEACDPDPAGSQAHHRGQFRGGALDPPDDLSGAAGQLLTLGREPDAPADPLHEPSAGLGLQPGQVMADGWLRVVQVLGGLGDRAVRGDRREDPQPHHIQHRSIYSWVTGRIGIGRMSLPGGTLSRTTRSRRRRTRP
jgi:hypothetical protein